MSDYKFSEQRIEVPEHDNDIILVFPNKKELVVQSRPTNADEKYNGSLDIILPDNDTVTIWKGDDMDEADVKGNSSYFGKQLVTELPFNPDEPSNPNPHEFDVVQDAD